MALVDQAPAMLLAGLALFNFPLSKKLWALGVLLFDRADDDVSAILAVLPHGPWQSERFCLRISLQGLRSCWSIFS